MASFTTPANTITYALSKKGVGQKLVLSSNNGDNWFVSPYTIVSGTWNDLSAAPNVSYIANAVDGTNAFYTTDGGINWSTSGGTYAGGDTAPFVFMVNAFVSYLAGENIAKSLDGGVTFDTLTDAATISGVPGAVVSALYFQNDIYGFVGIDDKLYETIDGGATWSVLNSNNPIAFAETIYGIASDASMGILVSTTTGVYKSVDAGSTWTNVLALPGSPTNLSYVHKVTSSIYYASFNITGYSVYKTINGGNTWTLQTGIYSDSSPDSVDLAMYSPLVGLRINQDDYIVKTLTSFNATSVVYNNLDMYTLETSPTICGACGGGYTLDPGTGKCTRKIQTNAACPDGYVYNPATGDCEGSSDVCEMDLTLVVDVSSSISDTEEDAYTDFLNNIITELEGGALQRISGGDIKVGIVKFETTAANVTNLTNTISTLTTAINAGGFISGGGTNTTAGLDAGWQNVIGVGSRPLVAKKLLLITDGIPNNGDMTGFLDNYYFNMGDYPAAPGGNGICGVQDKTPFDVYCDFLYSTLAIARDIKTGNYITKSVVSHVGGGTYTLSDTSQLVIGMRLDKLAGVGTFNGITRITDINGNNITVTNIPLVDFDNTTVLGFGLDTSGVTADIVLVTVGTAAERQYTGASLINGGYDINCPNANYPFSGAEACSTSDNTLYPLASLKPNGQPNYYETEFQGANAIVADLISGLCFDSVSPTCDADCEVITSFDGIKYTSLCECVKSIDVNPCCYQLTNCSDPLAAPIFSQDVADYEGQVVTVDEYPGECYKVEKVNDTLCRLKETITVNDSFDGANPCFECKPSYKFSNCEDPSIVYYSDNFSNFGIKLTPGDVINLVELPKSCWIYGINDVFPYTSTTLTLANGKKYDNCETCQKKYYQLTNCVNNSIKIITDNNLSAQLGKTVELKGYPGLCWTVTERTCECIKISIITVGGGPSLDTTLNVGSYIDGRPAYYLTFDGDDYILGWDGTEDQWQLYNVTTSTLESYINMDKSCPFSYNWATVNGIMVSSIESCITDLYDVEVQATYVDCECCLDKNCR